MRHLYKLDSLYGLLLTFGLALLIEGTFRTIYGVSGQPYAPPRLLSGGVTLGFMYLPIYRAWVVVASLLACLLTWLLIEKTGRGALLPAIPETQRPFGALVLN